MEKRNDSGCEKDNVHAAEASSCNGEFHSLDHKQSWKVIHTDSKRVLYRTNGYCRQESKYNVNSICDPRETSLKFPTFDVDLIVPHWTLDNNSLPSQPMHEVSVFELNDNVNENFLQDMCRKYGYLIELAIYFHPSSKKHLGIAYIVFESVRSAYEFVHKYNGQSVMGSRLACVLDPFGTKLSQRYEELTNDVLPVPLFLRKIDEEILRGIRSDLLSKTVYASETEVFTERAISAPYYDTAERMESPDNTKALMMSLHTSQTPLNDTPPAISASSSTSVLDSSRNVLLSPFQPIYPPPLSYTEIFSSPPHRLRPVLPHDLAPSFSSMNGHIEFYPRASSSNQDFVEFASPPLLPHEIEKACKSLHEVQDTLIKPLNAPPAPPVLSFVSNEPTCSSNPEIQQRKPGSVWKPQQVSYSVGNKRSILGERRIHSNCSFSSSNSSCSNDSENDEVSSIRSSTLRKERSRNGNRCGHVVEEVVIRKVDGSETCRKHATNHKGLIEEAEEYQRIRKSNVQDSPYLMRCTTADIDHVSDRSGTGACAVIDRTTACNRICEKAGDDASGFKNVKAESRRKITNLHRKSLHRRRKKSSSSSDISADGAKGGSIHHRWSSSSISSDDSLVEVLNSKKSTGLFPVCDKTGDSLDSREFNDSNFNCGKHKITLNNVSNCIIGSTLGRTSQNPFASTQVSICGTPSFIQTTPSTSHLVPYNSIPHPHHIKIADACANISSTMGGDSSLPPINKHSDRYAISKPSTGFIESAQQHIRNPNESGKVQWERKIIERPDAGKSISAFEEDTREYVCDNDTREDKHGKHTLFMSAVLDYLSTDLQCVLQVDLLKRIETFGFEKLERNWRDLDESQQQEGDEDLNNDRNSVNFDSKDGGDKLENQETSRPKNSLDEVLRRVDEQSRGEISATLGSDTAAFLGTGLFSQSFVYSLPSFKKREAGIAENSLNVVPINDTVDSNRDDAGYISNENESIVGESDLEANPPSVDASCATEVSEQLDKDDFNIPPTPSPSPCESKKGEYEDEVEKKDNNFDGSGSALGDSDNAKSSTYVSVGDNVVVENSSCDVMKPCTDGRGHSTLFEGSSLKNDSNPFQRFESSNLEGSAINNIKNIDRKSSRTIPSAEAKVKIDELQKPNVILEKDTHDPCLSFWNDHCYVAVRPDASGHPSKFTPVCQIQSHDQPKKQKSYFASPYPSISPPLGMRYISSVPVRDTFGDENRKRRHADQNNYLERVKRDTTAFQNVSKKWRMRTQQEEEKIIKRFLENGFDDEDLVYAEKAFYELHDDEANYWDRDLYWVPQQKIRTVKLLNRPKKLGKIDLFYDDPELCGIFPHSAGCLRAQGYYKMSNRQKRVMTRRPGGGVTEISERDEKAVRYLTQASKEARSMNRRLLTTMGDVTSDFFKINQLKYRKKMVKFAPSLIHGWGLFALEPIAPDEMIVEYIGQKIRPTVADEREKRYEKRGMGSSYLFRIDSDNVIDATQMGNFARFINHSCQPNCYAKVLVVDGEKRIVIYSKVLINKGDEITYDYKFPIEDDKIDCLCGATNCRGTLN